MQKQDKINPQVKICGITKLEDAQICIENKIDCIGFIYFKKSKRFISIKDTLEITGRISGIKKAGVFVNEKSDFILRAVKEAGLDIIQLHGNESPLFIEKIKSETNAKIIKCLYFDSHPKFENIGDYKGLTDAFLIEASKDVLPGGNGLFWDYSRISRYCDDFKLVVAGGLNPENFCDAVEKSRCIGFDMSSGVEISPGIKDHSKIEQIGKLKNQILIENKNGGIF